MEDVEENSKKHKDIHTHTYIDSHPTKSPKNPTQNGSFVNTDTSNHLEKSTDISNHKKIFIEASNQWEVPNPS